MPKIELTKEECLKAFNHILHCDRDTCSWISDAYRNDFSTLYELINEHFELKEIIKNHGLENLTLHELDCAFRKMLSYVEENNRLMNFLSQQNEIIKEYQNGEAYKELKRSYDELLGHAVAFQEELINLKDNPPLKFEELKPGMWVWDNKWKTYYTIGKFRNKNIYARYVRFVVDPYTEESEVDYGWMGVFEENRFYRYEVKE